VLTPVLLFFILKQIASFLKKKKENVKEAIFMNANLQK